MANAIAVDAAGNAYVAGYYRTAQGSTYSFVAKLDSNGNIVFSIPLGGSAQSIAQAIAVNGAGRILVSGISLASSFPSTTGTYAVPNTAGYPFLLELDPTGTQTIFSATGIGGSAMALDSSGNIYIAGTTIQLDYPTTPGAYQTVFPAFYACTSFLCQIAAQGPNQYVSKIDPTGSKLLYSTALTGTGSTTNAGLAVDNGGNAYVTGFAGTGYPFTAPATTAPPNCAPGVDCSTATFHGLPFLSKLDPTGQTLLFSVPVGGVGVQVDPAGNVDVGGSVGLLVGAGFAVPQTLPVLSNVPSQCLPNGLSIEETSYAAQVDASSGDVLGTQFLGGSTLTVSGVALSGSTLWIAGVTNDPDVPFTTGALTLSSLSPGAGAGAYLGAVDFSAPLSIAGTPQIACVLDSGDLTPVGPAARYQLLSVFGTGLGPATGVSAPNNATTELAGVEVDFGTVPAPLLYVSSTQINLAVPLLPNSQTISPVDISMAPPSASPAGLETRRRIPLETDRSARAFPLIYANPALVVNSPLTLPVTSNSDGFVAMALNADGSVNSPTNPAQLGSLISVFVNGLAPDPKLPSAPIQFSAQGWTVVNMQQPTPFLWEVTLEVPSTLAAVGSFSCPPGESSLCTVNFSLSYSSGTSGQSPVSSAKATSAAVYVNR